MAHRPACDEACRRSRVAAQGTRRPHLPPWAPPRPHLLERARRIPGPPSTRAAAPAGGPGWRAGGPPAAAACWDLAAALRSAKASNMLSGWAHTVSDRAQTLQRTGKGKDVIEM